jgi:peroxiredoxin
MALQPGDRAPDFTLYTDEAKPWALADALRDGPVVLFFFPGAFTSVCATELDTVNNDLASYTRAGARVVGISTDAPAALHEFRKVQRFQFPLLSDHDAEVAGAYGARFTKEEHRLGFSRIAKRATFVVGADGTVVYAHVLPSPAELPDFEAVLGALDGLAAADANGRA